MAWFKDDDLLMVKVEGEFVSQTHPETDAVFLVVEGQPIISPHEDTAERAVTRQAGGLFVVPRVSSSAEACASQDGESGRWWCWVRVSAGASPLHRVCAPACYLNIPALRWRS